MAISIDKVPYLKIKKTKLKYPINNKDRFHGSAIYLLTKNIDDSIDFLTNNNIMENNKTFTSYYAERDYKFYYRNMEALSESYNETESSIIESTLYSLSKSKLNELSFSEGENDVTIYPDVVDMIVNEDFKYKQNYPAIFRRFLYKERIKTQKNMLDLYKEIKNKVDFIKYTYITLNQYKAKNLIIDWSYYSNLFFKNNDRFKRDKGLDLLHHIMTRYLNDSRLEENGYTKKTAIIPIFSWYSNDESIDDFTNYTKSINPFSMMIRLVKQKYQLKYFNIDDFLVISDNAYFRFNPAELNLKNIIKFKRLVTSLINSSDINDDEEDEQDNDNERMVSSGIVDNKKDEPISPELKDIEDEEEPIDTELTPKSSEIEVNDNDYTDDWEKSIIGELNEEDNSVKLTDARKARIAKLNKDYDNIVLNNKKIKTLLDNYIDDDTKINSEPIPVDSINEEWKSVKTLNFNKEYDIDKDIAAIFKCFSTKSRPLSVVKMSMEDTSTYIDYIYTITATMEDMNGKRSTITVDIPKFINNRFMKLRGNLKTISGELMLLPIIKTEEDKVQIVTSYHKIFIERVNPSNGTKTTKGVSLLNKVLSKLSENKSDIKVYEGDNSLICSKYDLPIEFRDLAGIHSSIVTKDGSYISFDYDKNLELLGKSKYNDKTHIIIGYDNKTKTPIYANKNNVAYDICEFLSSKDNVFKDICSTTKPSAKLSYSSASIMNTNIPIIVLMAFSEGLQKSMDKSNIKYRFSDKRSKIDINKESAIKLKDGYIVYNDELPQDSLLMSGLSKCDLSDYSIKEINTKRMWLELLDNFGGRIKADGLDNFYDCEFDPMSINICKNIGIPYDYVEALAYANKLLAYTEYNKHSDISGNRIRTNEIVAGYLYQAMANAYGDYCNKSKRSPLAKITIKRSSVIDAIMKDPVLTDLSILSPLLEAESMMGVSFKGLSGMNTDRAYTLDKRVYDDSMLGILGTSTGFAGNVGISRQLTIDSSIDNTRGKLNHKSYKDLNTLNALTVYEALTPYATTHDDPVRTAMGYIQTTKHQMRVKSSNPSLITYGMDEALPYFTSDVFSYKFKGVKGKVIDINNNFIIYEGVDKDGNKFKDAVDLNDNIMKNSDGGFYVTVKLIPKVKKGQSLKYNDILAYDATSYSPSVASSKKNKDNISYNIGTLSKIAIMCTDEAYEDSSIINERLVDALTSFYCIDKECSLSPGSNIFDMVKKGEDIQEGKPLLIFQDAFDDDEANKLIKNMEDDNTELISDFGRIHIRSKITGTVQDIKIARTCELSELSPSLRKIVSNYEKEIDDKKKKLKSYGISDISINSMLDPTGKIEPEGRYKALNGVSITFYIKCRDKMSVGDKLTYNTAIKGVVKDVMPKNKEPFTDFRPNEPIDALLTSASVNARMTPSVIITGCLNKILIELSRKCKDILGIKWSNLTNVNNLDK